MAGHSTKPLEDFPPRSSSLSHALKRWAPDIHRHCLLAIIPFYAILMPVASALTRPTGYFSLFLDQVYGPRDTKSVVKLVGLVAFHTYCFSAVLSVYGQSSYPGGYQINGNPPPCEEPDPWLFPSSGGRHEALMDVFPVFGAAAALILATHTMVKNPTNTGSPSVTVINGLFLHVFFKHILFYISYLADAGVLRANFHVLATSTIINVLYELYQGLV
ncbi:hypothetical protein BS47DRAFT_1360881 [Hydnum rufescens UP504]|uniref:Uncharacterized protein n=1 Tax=Hydnum rufescens UP504 TaxID=1448309 RepID=A0A9P6DZ41_9AGAM|nr:hypothetical protein BS47DRAFT_1360881 [Hydnum rufescens UP504]